MLEVLLLGHVVVDFVPLDLIQFSLDFGSLGDRVVVGRPSGHRSVDFIVWLE